jgi:hypothetical protein
VNQKHDQTEEIVGLWVESQNVMNERIDAIHAAFGVGKPNYPSILS